MDSGTILIGFAQIAIALMGFTTIAAVVVQISESTTANLLATRLKTTLLLSTQLLIIAVLPLVFYHHPETSDDFWKFAAMGSFATGIVAAIIGTLDQLPKVLRDDKISWTQTICVMAFGFASIGTLLLTTMKPNPAFWYFAAIALSMASIMTMIIGMVLSFPVFDVQRPSIQSKKQKSAEA